MPRASFEEHAESFNVKSRIQSSNNLNVTAGASSAVEMEKPWRLYSSPLDQTHLSLPAEPEPKTVRLRQPKLRQ